MPPHDASTESYPEQSIGSMMEPPIAVFPAHTTVAEAVELIRELATSRLFTYGYITDPTGVLLGDLSEIPGIIHPPKL